MNYRISTEPGARLRIDKWLWAARFFKTRSLAADAVEKGRVRIGGATVKPSKDVRVGDPVEIQIEQVLWQVEVLGICDVRGPATIAQTLYAETSEGREKRLLEQERARRIASRPRPCKDGRPSVTGALSTNFQVGIEQVFHRLMHTTVFGRAFVDGPGHTDGRGTRDKYQSDHRDCEGQFHGTPLMDAGLKRRSGWVVKQLRQWVAAKLTPVRVNVSFRTSKWSLGQSRIGLNLNLMTAA